MEECWADLVKGDQELMERLAIYNENSRTISMVLSQEAPLSNENEDIC